MGSFSKNTKYNYQNLRLIKERLDVQTKIFDKLFKFEKEYIFINVT